MIVWDKHYELGIASIDNQHKELVRIAGELSNLLTEACEGDDIYDEMIRLIEELRDYTVVHFEFEEALFIKHGYPNSDEHILEHQRLIEEINALDFQAVDNDQVAHGKSILNMLITWIFKHISGSDFKYRDYLLDKKVT